MIIYKTTNLINNKIYVGQDKNNNPYYLGSGKILLRAIKKYGRDNFSKKILEICNSNDELNKKEEYWIRKLNSTDRKIGYNISIGGVEGDREKGQQIIKNGVYEYWLKKYGKEEADKKLEIKKEKLRIFNIYKKKNGWTHTKEAKEKISKFNKGKKLSKETKKKISNSRKGIKFSDETRKRMSISQKGKISPNKGKSMSEETKIKISNTLKGRDGTNNKPFLVDDTRYDRLRDASEKLNIKISTISYRLKSKNYKNYIFIDEG